MNTLSEKPSALNADACTAIFLLRISAIYFPGLQRGLSCILCPQQLLLILLNNLPQIVGNLPQALVQAPVAQINPGGGQTQLQQLAVQGVASPQDKVVKERLAIAKKIMEQYYGKKVDELDPTGIRATKRQWQRLEEFEDDYLGLEVSKKSAKEKADQLDLEFEADQCKLAVSAQCTSAAALHSMALEDYKSASMWAHQAHHIARIIAGDNKAR
ncbi:MAG: hypothetical protein EZS28_013223 [Streblomastix strix]|uniref:Uncharacterized protein n=1 Tax=Streblomastix strix TaxID=222440 RepID=A0A5J4WA45_9EUKA|nr:MAG: hypothetical protein EZS28_013223 [Streblomastix strix]